MVIGYYQEVTYTIHLHNTGTGSTAIDLVDTPPLAYVPGSAVGGIWWDDGARSIRWQGTLAHGESRLFQFRVYGPDPGIPVNTVYTNRVVIRDGAGQTTERTADVLANPATPPPFTGRAYLPIVTRQSD
jgi:hypothetical protein